jgi:dTDP-glucose 4,6-dehydratase
MKNALITGGAGSIGVHVIAEIMTTTDWNVVILDSFRHKGYRERITKLCENNPEWLIRIKEIQHDLVCPISTEMKNAIGHVDYIIHLAAISDVFYAVENPVYAIKNNIDSTLTMLEYARDIKPESFIYFSTDEVYGPVHKGEAHVEWDSHRPSNSYSASKAASEDICYSYWRSYGVPLIITNTMNNYGEMQSSSKFPVIVQKKIDKEEEIIIHGNDKEIGTRFYIHSRDVANALLHILNIGAHQHIIGEIDEPYRYHIVGDICLDNLELAERVAELMGKVFSYKLEDFHHSNPGHDIHYGLQDNELRASGWKQPRTFDESMKETIEWQQRNPEWIN